MVDSIDSSSTSLICRVPPLNSGIACLVYLTSGIACLVSWCSDWLDTLWASLSSVQSSVTFVKPSMVGRCWGGTFNYPVSTCWLIDCALAHLFTSHFPLFTFTRNPVIPAANHSSDPLHMCAGICILIGLLCFQFPGTLVQ